MIINLMLLVLFLTFFISVFAIYNTHFKTVFILNPIIVGYLIYLRYFKFNFRISFPSILSNIGILLYFIPIYLLQLLLYYDFSKRSIVCYLR